VLVLSAVLAGWFLFGRIPVVVRGSGILLSPDGLLQVTSSAAGRVSEMLVQAGDGVEAGQVLATVTDETAAVYAAVRVSLRQAGRPIPANDAWIAALALQHRLPILSRDEHFDAVPGLDRRDW